MLCSKNKQIWVPKITNAMKDVYLSKYFGSLYEEIETYQTPKILDDFLKKCENALYFDSTFPSNCFVCTKSYIKFKKQHPEHIPSFIMYEFHLIDENKCKERWGETHDNFYESVFRKIDRNPTLTLCYDFYLILQIRKFLDKDDYIGYHNFRQKNKLTRSLCNLFEIRHKTFFNFYPNVWKSLSYAVCDIIDDSDLLWYNRHLSKINKINTIKRLFDNNHIIKNPPLIRCEILNCDFKDNNPPMNIFYTVFNETYLTPQAIWNHVAAHLETTFGRMLLNIKGEYPKTSSSLDISESEYECCEECIIQDTNNKLYYLIFEDGYWHPCLD